MENNSTFLAIIADEIVTFNNEVKRYNDIQDKALENQNFIVDTVKKYQPLCDVIMESLEGQEDLIKRVLAFGFAQMAQAIDNAEAEAEAAKEEE